MSQNIVIGVRRQGKSTLTLSLAMKSSPGTVIFDPNNQFRMIKPVHTPQELHWALEDNEQKIVRYLPDPDRIWDDFTEFAKVVWYTLGGQYSLIIDEADQIQTPNKMNSMLAMFVRRAPTDEDYPNTVNIYQSTHRPGDLNSVVKALATDWYIFRMTLARDVQVIDEQWGEEIAAKVQQLDKFTFLHAWLAEGGVRKYEIVADPSTWYVKLRQKGDTLHGQTRR